MIVSEVIERAIQEAAFPGTVYAYRKSPGRWMVGVQGGTTYCPDSPRMSNESIFDLASLSKVISTTSLVMLAVQSRQIDLDQKVTDFWQEFGQNGKSEITLRHLMVHRAGLIAFRPYYRQFSSQEEVMASIASEALQSPIDSKTVYSDLSMMVVQACLEKVFGQPLDQLFKTMVARPLGLSTAGYFRLGDWIGLSEVHPQHCVPTERMEDWRRTLRRRRLGDLKSVRLYGHDPEFIRGEVHDPSAAAISGVAGHAGLFASILDLTRFVDGLLNERLVNHDLVHKFIRCQDPEKSTRALGWDTKSPTGSSAGKLMGPLSFGHTGYTGTSIWVDPESGIAGILLANRVHPTSENLKIQQVRPLFYDAIFRSLAN